MSLFLSYLLFSHLSFLAAAENYSPLIPKHPKIQDPPLQKIFHPFELTEAQMANSNLPEYQRNNLSSLNEITDGPSKCRYAIPASNFDGPIPYDVVTDGQRKGRYANPANCFEVQNDYYSSEFLRNDMELVSSPYNQKTSANVEGGFDFVMPNQDQKTSANVEGGFDFVMPNQGGTSRGDIDQTAIISAPKIEKRPRNDKDKKYREKKRATFDDMKSKMEEHKQIDMELLGVKIKYENLKELLVLTDKRREEDAKTKEMLQSIVNSLIKKDEDQTKNMNRLYKMLMEGNAEIAELKRVIDELKRVIAELKRNEISHGNQ